MKKVFVIGPSYFNFNYSIGKAFEELSFTVKIVEYDEPIHPFNWKNKVLNKLLFNPEYLKQASIKSFNQSVLKDFSLFNPDLVFIYNGDILQPETILYFKETSKVVLWELDGVYRHPRSEALAPLVDAFFCFEQNDVTYLKKKGIQSYFLPQACETEIYHPLPQTKDIDLLFVGTLYAYPTRIKLLKKIVDSFPQYNIQVYGLYKPWYKNPFKWLFREKRSIFKNKNISPEEVNKLYNRSRICMNVHHEQSKSGANPKVFEIPGSGAFQLVDWNPYIESLFPNGEVAMYHSEKELLEMVDYYLKTDTTQQALQANRIVYSEHRFINRISEVLSIINL